MFAAVACRDQLAPSLEEFSCRAQLAHVHHFGSLRHFGAQTLPQQGARAWPQAPSKVVNYLFQNKLAVLGTRCAKPPYQNWYRVVSAPVTGCRVAYSELSRQTMEIGNMLNRKLVTAAVAATLMSGAGYSQAEDEFAISGNVALTSDYRFRGISQSDESAAVQGGF